jgi:RNA polymerase sigma-70 factor (ECF subfamily)
MRRLQQGDRRAFDDVFAQAWPRVLAMCRRALPHAADAEDAAQRALARVFERASLYDPARSALAFVLSTAAWEVRTVRTQHRRATARHGEGNPHAAGSEGGPADPEAQLMEHEWWAGVNEAMAQLSEADRQLVVEALAGESGDNRTPLSGVVRKRRQRAFERLRAAWRTLYGR